MVYLILGTGRLASWLATALVRFQSETLESIQEMEPLSSKILKTLYSTVFKFIMIFRLFEGTKEVCCDNHCNVNKLRTAALSNSLKKTGGPPH